VGSDAETQIARRAAQRLAGDIDPTLPDQVEQELAKDPLEQSHERPLDPISLGGLIVSLVSLGWTIYRDLKKDREAAQKAAMMQRLADRLREDTRASGQLPRASERLLELNPQQQTLIIEAVAQEIVEEPLPGSR